MMARFRSDALKLKAATTSAACPASRNASARSSSTSSSIISPWTHSSKESRRCASKWGAAAAEMASSSASLAAGSRRNESAASATARRPRWASLPWARRKGGEHGREGGRVPFSFHRTAFLFLLRGVCHTEVARCGFNLTRRQERAIYPYMEALTLIMRAKHDGRAPLDGLSPKIDPALGTLAGSGMRSGGPPA